MTTLSEFPHREYPDKDHQTKVSSDNARQYSSQYWKSIPLFEMKYKEQIDPDNPKG
jgi:hypothetical protein